MRKAVWPVFCLSASLLLTGAEADDRTSPPPSQAGRDGTISTFRFNAPWEMGNRVNQGSRVGDMVYVAGQFSHDAAGTFIGEGDVAEQTRKTFANIDDVLSGLGASKQGIVELEVFLIDPKNNLAPFIAEYKRYVGDGSLTVTLVGVTALAYPQELVEIRAVAHAMPTR